MRRPRSRAPSALGASLGFCLVLALLFALGIRAQSQEAEDGLDLFTESVYLQGLKTQGYFVAHFDFRFKTRFPLSAETGATRHQHYDIFPKEIGKLLTLHLQSSLPSPSLAAAPPLLFFDASLTQGRWLEAAWGVAPTAIRPPGAVLRAALSSNPVYDSQRTWSLLTHALGGIMCTAFSMLKNEEMAYTLAPSSFSHVFEDKNSESEEKAWTLRVATSPVEVACTENLNSLQKLLPCRGEAGLLSRVHPLAFASSPFKSVRFLAFTEAEENSLSSAFLRAELRALLTVVLPIPRDGEARFTLPELFSQRGRPGASPPPLLHCVASSSRVLVRLPRPGVPEHGDTEDAEDAGEQRDTKHSLQRNARETARVAAAEAAVASTGASRFNLYSVDAFSDLIVFDAFPSREAPDLPRKDPLFAKEILRAPSDGEGLLSGRLDVERQQTGRGTASSKLERMEGAWLLVFRNRHAFGQRSVRYFDNFPPFLFPLLHTARVSWKSLPRKATSSRKSGRRGEDGQDNLCQRAFSPVAKQLHLTGAQAARTLNLRLLASSSSFIENPAPTFLSLAFALPPRCQIEFSVGVEKRYWPASRFSFSPDKGSDVPGAIVLDMPSYLFSWPPPPAVLDAPLACNVGSACAASLLISDAAKGKAGKEAPLSLEVAAEGLYAPGQRDSWNWQITEGMIVHLPLPDFSMPFNVIALSGTVLTLFYGSVFRITTMEW
ncbi:putative Gpi16 subunit, GPI transamidase domain-containing protein [Neospora caninum Liverpool]|nr:putative Gpi16 subunit, GPI transamidase domain-containing protein [Neospora caninum Liverpool]CBZ55639.1 putative Gpi16 subunit, GPI transamidase domain-containing protein [Neospora caninum Liverpool]|eukprot:XP_003885667.1 putative Gpi16 subunit, GPI transamidase domain-containing protein [Neospora caninum Liverpool]